jgi:uncharacterized protein (TIGR00290 family)
VSEKVVVLWSGGKDSALALHEVCRHYEFVSLLTTVTEPYGRVSMHGVRTELLEQQASALQIPVEKVPIPAPCPNTEYEARMRAALETFRGQGVTAAVSGDIFLEDVRAYRERLLASAGLQGVFPLWGRDTHELARHFLALGFRAVVCCVDAQALDGAFAGRAYDENLLAELPPVVDPCGERGEFHTFVSDGPLFTRPVAYQVGERVLRDDRFWFCDLLPS